MSVSKKFHQILDVLALIRSAAPSSRHSTEEARIDALKMIADAHGVDSTTVSDKWRRQLRLEPDEEFGTPQFDDIVWAWIGEGDGQLADRCARIARSAKKPDDVSAVKAFFEAPEKYDLGLKHRHLAGDCVVWASLESEEVSIVVNSVGGGRVREAGLTELLSAITTDYRASWTMGCHPSGKAFIELDDVPTPEEIRLDPAAATRRVLTALGRVRIAVGTPLSGRPPHRSGHAGFQHPAPASGRRRERKGWLAFEDPWDWERVSAIVESKLRTGHPGLLAPPLEGLPPAQPDLIAEGLERPEVGR